MAEAELSAQRKPPALYPQVEDQQMLVAEQPLAPMVAWPAESLEHVEMVLRTQSSAVLHEAGWRGRHASCSQPPGSFAWLAHTREEIRSLLHVKDLQMPRPRLPRLPFRLLAGPRAAPGLHGWLQEEKK